MIELLFLGSGTSFGVPMVGCDCDVCTSDDPRNSRLRPSVLVRNNGRAILVDTATELRLQALRHGIKTVDAILYTHIHADHMHGIDDARAFSGYRRAAIDTYGDRKTIDHIRRTYRYIFADGGCHLGWGIPRLALHVIEEPTEVAGMLVTPIPIMHGEDCILGYRFGRLAYLTDCNGIPETSMPLLEGLDTLILDGTRKRPHPTHFTVSEAVEAAQRIGPRITYLTHICHDIDHAATEAELPPNIRLAYDGLEIQAPA